MRLQQAVALGIGIVPKELPLMKGEVPVCRDFMKGECKRGARCKFRHVPTSPQYDLDLAQKEQITSTPTQVTLTNNNTLTNINTMSKFDAFTEELDRYEYEQLTVKRRRTDYDSYLDTFTVKTTTDYRLLEEENVLLRRKVDELKKQVHDLAATNEVLLEQNARYRVSKVSVTAAPPMMTVSHMMTPTIAPAPIVARPCMHGPPQPLNILTTTLTEPLTVNANNELMVSHQALQSRLQAPELSRLQAPELTRLQAPELSRLQAPELSRLQAPELSRLQAPELSRLQAPELSRLQAPELSRLQPGDLQAQQASMGAAAGNMNTTVSVVPVSLAPSDNSLARPLANMNQGTLGPASMAPVTMPPGSMAPGNMTSVTMTPVTMAPQQMQQPPPSATLSQSTPGGGTVTLLSGPNTTLVSYPIMSNTQLPNSSLATTLRLNNNPMVANALAAANPGFTD